MLLGVFKNPFPTPLSPAEDDAPSSAIQSAVFDGFRVEITFANGKTYAYPCTQSQWIDYTTSESRGAAFNELFRGK